MSGGGVGGVGVVAVGVAGASVVCARWPGVGMGAGVAACAAVGDRVGGGGVGGVGVVAVGVAGASLCVLEGLVWEWEQECPFEPPWETE